METNNKSDTIIWLFKTGVFGNLKIASRQVLRNHITQTIFIAAVLATIMGRVAIADPKPFDIIKPDATVPTSVAFFKSTNPSQDLLDKFKTINDQREAERVAAAKAEAARLAEVEAEKQRAAEAARIADAPRIQVQQPVYQATTNCGSEYYQQKIYSSESGCRLVNPNGSGCDGIGQACPIGKLIAACPDWQTNWDCQNNFFTKYMQDVYGTWENAWAKWQSRCGSPQGCWW